MINKRLLRVGFVQNNPVFGNVQKNLARVEKLLEGQSADLFVFPELFATGYQFKNKKEVQGLAEQVPEGTTTNALTSVAKKTTHL